jgi:hypothetical protein
MECAVMAISGGKTLTVYLAADLKKFNSGMTQAQGGLKGFANSMTSMLGPAAIGAGLALGALATKMAVDGVKAAMANEESLVKLTNTLENLGLAHNTQQIEDYIYQLERSLGVADTELRPAYQKLVVATGNVGKANDALALALDVSAASGKSLEQVTEALSKAFSGQIAGLSRLNLGIDAATIRSGDMDLILQRLAETTSGAAAASADTLTGRMKVLQTAVDNLGEAFGQGLVNSMKKGTEGTDELVKNMAELEDGLTTAGERAGTAGFSIADFGVKAFNAYLKFADFMKTMQDSGTPIQRLTANLFPGGLAAKILGQNLSDAASSAYDLSAAAGATAARMQGLADSIMATTAATAAFNDETGEGPVYKNSGVNPYAEYLRLQRIGVLTLPQLTEKVEVQAQATGSAAKAVEGLTKKEQKLIDKYDELSESIQGNRNSLSFYVQELENATAAIDDFTLGMQENLLAGVDLGKAYTTAKDEGGNIAEGTVAGFQAMIDKADWMGNVLMALKGQGVDPSLISYLASQGAEVAGGLGEAMLGDKGLLSTLNEKWVGVQETTKTLAEGLVPEFLIAGQDSALEYIDSISETMANQVTKLAKIGKKIAKPIGQSFKAELLADVAEAVRAVEATGTAARAEAVARAEAQQSAITNQAVAQALRNVILDGDRRLGNVNKPLVA